MNFFKFLFKPLIAVYVVLTYTIAPAQTARFSHINVDNGLLANQAFCMTSDENGFMWIGTPNGLNRFDGSTYLAFTHDPNNPRTLSSNMISCLLVDGKTLWVGTHNAGLNKIDLTTNQVTRLPYNEKGKGMINYNRIISLAKDQNNIYVGTIDNGLNIVHKKSNKVTYLKNDSSNTNSILTNTVRALTIDQQGKLWMGHTNGGVTCWDIQTNKFTRFTTGPTQQNGLNGATVRAIFCDSKNRIWMSTWVAGVNVYDQQTGKMIFGQDLNHMHKSMDTYLAGKGMIFNISEDKIGNVWLASVEQGLLCYNSKTGKVSQFKNNPSDPGSIGDNNVLSIHVDRSNQVWAGTLSAGISIFNPYAYGFGLIKADETKNGLNNNQILSIHYGKTSNTVYVGALGFVYKFDPRLHTFTNVVVDKKGQSLLSTQALIQAIHEDKKGNLWISVNGSAVYRYTPAQYELIKYEISEGPTGPYYYLIEDIKEDQQGNIWFALNYGGVDKYSYTSNEFEHFLYDSKNSYSVSSTRVLSMDFDKDQQLWLATDSGLCIKPIHKNSFIRIKHNIKKRNGINTNSINAVFKDSNGNMWLGTTLGLSKYDYKTKTFRHYKLTTTDQNVEVSGICEDKAGNLWLTGSKGLIKFNKYTLKTNAFDITDGLQSNEFSAQAIASFPNGYVMAGGSKGLNYFLPQELTSNETIPSLAFTNILLRNKKISGKTLANHRKKVILGYDHYFFTIEFATLDFVNTQKNQYRYKMIGLNNEWIDLGNKNQVTFVNLDPGDYTLHVIGSNNNQIWNEEGIQLKIVITPPFWRTWWFYTICAIIVLLSVYSFIRYRERKLTREKVVLENKVELRTKELRHEKEKVEEAHKEIKDSINYAQKIQTAILPSENDFKQLLPHSFVLFKPKDVVSGDFYWIHNKSGFTFYATADCTGHGVPGGFMSMLGTSFLNEIIVEGNVLEPADILNQLREKVINALKQTGAVGENKDGMDIALCRLSKEHNQLVFAGANNGAYFLRNGQMKELVPDKMPIGFFGEKHPFTQQVIELTRGDMIFTYTDGYADQFGGPKGKKFKYSQLQQLLLENAHLEPKILNHKLLATFNQWKGDLEQIDDVCIIGIKL